MRTDFVRNGHHWNWADCYGREESIRCKNSSRAYIRTNISCSWLVNNRGYVLTSSMVRFDFVGSTFWLLTGVRFDFSSWVRFGERYVLTVSQLNLRGKKFTVIRAHLASRDYITFDLKLLFNVFGLRMCYMYVYKIRLASFSCLGFSLYKQWISLMEFGDITYFLTKLAKIAVHMTIFILSFLSSV